jgi:hypothetical protein
MVLTKICYLLYNRFVPVFYKKKHFRAHSQAGAEGNGGNGQARVEGNGGADSQDIETLSKRGKLSVVSCLQCSTCKLKVFYKDVINMG